MASVCKQIGMQRERMQNMYHFTVRMLNLVAQKSQNHTLALRSDYAMTQ